MPHTRRQNDSYGSGLVHWLQLKKYQYEVTFSLYMMTPTEKFVFNIIIFALLSMLVTASIFYLPDHVATIFARAWYYAIGESVEDSFGVVGAAKSGLISGLPKTIMSATHAAARNEL